jgi:glycyl-tRNA synthetase
MEEFDMWLEKIKSFLFDNLSFNNDNVKFVEIPKDELAHYSNRTVDIQYNFPQGFSELWGIAHRGTHDLTSHINESGKDLVYVDPTNGNKIVPNVIEPSVGIDRLFYAIICEKFDVEKIKEDDEREVLRLPFELAPYKFAILPLSNKLEKQAYEVYKKIIDKGISCSYDVSGSIGKRYRRQDAIGTPYCITYDFNSEETNKITIRERDSMKQETIDINDLEQFLIKKAF